MPKTTNYRTPLDILEGDRKNFVFRGCDGFKMNAISRCTVHYTIEITIIDDRNYFNFIARFIAGFNQSRMQQASVNYEHTTAESLHPPPQQLTENVVRPDNVDQHVRNSKKIRNLHYFEQEMAVL